MAFRGLASPSQARARNMHNAERVVRLLAVLLNLEFWFGHTKVGQHQISVLKIESVSVQKDILVYHIFAIVCSLLNAFLDSLQAFDCFIELKSGVQF